MGSQLFVYITDNTDNVAKLAIQTEGSEHRWVRQAVRGVMRWRDLPGTRSSTGTMRSLSTTEVNRKLTTAHHTCRQRKLHIFKYIGTFNIRYESEESNIICCAHCNLQ